MSNRTVYFFNTGGVEWSAEELESVLTEGDSSHQWGHKEAPTRYDSGEGWEGWRELTWGEHFVQIDGVEHKINLVEQEYSGEGYNGSRMLIVFELEGRHFRVDGIYYSYGESTWGSLREVTKQTKTVEVYE